MFDAGNQCYEPARGSVDTLGILKASSGPRSARHYGAYRSGRPRRRQLLGERHRYPRRPGELNRPGDTPGSLLLQCELFSATFRSSRLNIAPKSQTWSAGFGGSPTEVEDWTIRTPHCMGGHRVVLHT